MFKISKIRPPQSHETKGLLSGLTRSRISPKIWKEDYCRKSTFFKSTQKKLLSAQSSLNFSSNASQNQNFYLRINQLPSDPKTSTRQFFSFNAYVLFSHVLFADFKIILHHCDIKSSARDTKSTNFSRSTV